VADLIAIRNAIAANITRYTGLRCDAQARDAVNPPCAVVLPGNPYLDYGVSMDGAINFNFIVLVIISDAAPVEQTQRALDTLLGAGQDADIAASVPTAIEQDNTLGGAVDFIQAQTVTQYGRIEYAGQTVFGARINVIAGGM
jgi:hypothetical protein